MSIFTFIASNRFFTISVCFSHSKRSNMPTEAEVADKLTNVLHPTHLEVTDFSDGCGAKFNVIVVTPEFDGKPLLDRHRMVNDALSDEMNSIHALTMKTYTPEQWQKMSQK